MSGRKLRQTVAEGEAGKRVDAFLAKAATLSRAYVKQLIKGGRLLINQQPAKASQVLHEGDKVALDIPKAEKVPVEIPIIYEDEQVIVYNKPAGLLTHSKGAFNPEFTVADALEPNTEDRAPNRAGIVHRLDRDTSGVIIGAKTMTAKQKLQRQFAQRTTKKTYVAVVEGQIDEPETLVKLPIERHPKHPQTFRVGAGGKEAETLVTVIARNSRYSLVQLEPLTGRTHQLRVHLAHIGHPIVGDRLYGHAGPELMLHAHQLEITIPVSQRKFFTAPLRPAMADFIEEEHLQWPS